MKSRFLRLLIASLLTTSAALAQGISTGTIAGRVTADGTPVAAVTVTAASPALQGIRRAQTNDDGQYTLPLLPPGDYVLSYALDGLETQERSLRVSVAQSTAGDVEMAAATLAETIAVTGTAEAISTGGTAATTFTKSFVEELPIQRNLRETTLLTAGVSSTGPSQAITISGAYSFQSLFLIDGVVVNENLRGQPQNLFIEDAIDQTTTLTSGISAEYGRFSGGVVNMLTKSGGNDFSGTFRTSVTNDDWTAPTPVTVVDPTDKENYRYEATLGGRFVRDRLWYFAAARKFELTTTEQTARLDQPYTVGTDELRPQLKLTAALTPSQRVVGSYLEVDNQDFGSDFNNIAADLTFVDDRKLPQTLLVGNYSGVFGPNLTLEAQYSKRTFTFEGSGGESRDRILGSWIQEENGFRFNAPMFCGVCEPEGRDNENLLAKATWFGGGERLGTHEVSFGLDTFDDVRLSDNHQSASDYALFATASVIRDGVIYPIFIGGDSESALIVHFPILRGSEGTSFKTNSTYLNDRWRLGERVSLNLGVRYDENDGQDAEGKLVADDSRVSPRLGLSWDLRGDGNWLLNFGYGHYVDALANNIGDASSSAGTPAILVWLYAGPDINGPGMPLVPTHDAMARVFADWDSRGGAADRTLLVQETIPGETVVIDGTLHSPYVEEWTLGLVKQLGSRGSIRSDLVSRQWADFYSTRIDRTTGTTPSGGDRGLVGNLDDSSRLDRTYIGLHNTVFYRTNRWFLGGTWTISKTEGNFDGETAGSGPVQATVEQYPEYKQARWNSPMGEAATDQRHRVRAWAVWEAWRGERNHLNLSVLQNFYSGTPYGAVGSVNPRDASGRFGIPNPGYPSNARPATVTYFYTARDAFHTPDISSTDLSLNYTFDLDAGGYGVELYFQPEVLNVFDNDDPIVVNTTIFDPTSGVGLPRFNPFTETPVEGVNWRKGSQFGRGTRITDFQTPRTFRFSVGLRF